MGNYVLGHRWINCGMLTIELIHQGKGKKINSLIGTVNFIYYLKIELYESSQPFIPKEYLYELR